MIELRRIKSDEWHVFKTLRLAALQQNGEQFGQSYEEVSAFTDERWQEDTVKAAESDHFYVVIAFDGVTPIGMSACVRPGDFGKIIMVWVTPEYRGQAIGLLLVKKTMEVSALTHYKLTVVDGNLPAIRTYENLGFTPNGFSYINAKGLREIEMVCETAKVDRSV